MKIDICIATDDNYVKYCATVMQSVLENKAEDDEPVFHIIQGGLLPENLEILSKKGNVCFHKVDDDLFKPYKRKAKLSWPTPTLYRLKLASILDIDKVIYLDCDVIVTSSLKEYFSQDIEGSYLGCVPDVGYEKYMDNLGLSKENGLFYFNAGSILMNLKKFREDNIEEKLFDFLIEKWKDLTFGDQDVLNSVLYKNVKKIDRKFNYIPFGHSIKAPSEDFDIKRDISVIHYAGRKPWEIFYRNYFRREFWQYYKNSGAVSSKEFEKE